MIGDFGSWLIGGGLQVFGVPEVVGSEGVGSILFLEKATLVCESCAWTYEYCVLLDSEDSMRYIPRPLHTPAQNASVNLPSFSSNSGLIWVSGTRRIARSCVTGALFGLYLAKRVELKR